MGTGPLKPVLDSLLQDLKTGDKEKRSTLQGLWPQIIGPSFANHTKGTLRKGGTLSVWVDDSTLAYELSRRYQGTILKRARSALGEEAIQKIKFRVGEIR
jgi:predicted nucleic acid-binding Zn ribbon protein